MGKKVKILSEQFDKIIYNMLSEEPLLLNEATGTDLNKSDVEVIAKKTVRNSLSRSPELENKIKSTVRSMMKNDSVVEKAMIEVAKNVLVQLYKALWTKRTFWTNDLKNIAS